MTGGKLRTRIGDRLDLTEKQMFGGLAFPTAGSNCRRRVYGAVSDSRIVRVVTSEPHHGPLEAGLIATLAVRSV